MEQTKHHHQNKTPECDDVIYCNNFFSECQPSSWSYQEFLTYCSRAGPVKLEVLNSRYLKALEKIESCRTERQDRRKKARSLIDKHRSTHQKRNKGSSDPLQNGSRLVVHGDIIHAGRDVSITNGDRITVKRSHPSLDGPSGPAKRRTQARSSAPGPQIDEIAADAGKDTVCQGDVIHAGGNVEIANGDRQTSCSHRHVAPPLPTDAISDPGDDPACQAHAVKDANIASGERQIDDAASDTRGRAYDDFISSFSAMKNKSKFSTSGRVLEDVIFRQVMNSKSLEGNAILQWVVDPDDHVIASWFKATELDELRGWSPPLPEASDSFKYAVRRFSDAKTSQQFWDIVESSPRPPDEPYDRSKNFDGTYVNTVTGSILLMIESLQSCEWLGPQGLREGWFGSNVWGPIVDRGLQGVDNLVLSRTEIKSRSDAKSNKRFDAIILALAGVEVGEFGAIEVARTADTIAEDKRAIDSIKLVNVLQSMLCQLHTLVNNDWETMKQLQVVGIQHIGFSIQVSRMSSINRNVFLLQRGRLRTVPTTLEKFRTLFDIMHAIVVTKKIVERSIEVITRYNAEKLSRQGKDSFEGFEL